MRNFFKQIAMCEQEELVSNLLDLYLTNFAHQTQRSYRATLLEWSKSVGDIATATRADAIRFFAAQSHKEGARPRRAGQSTRVTRQTIERKRIILKSFYKFIAAEGVGDPNIFNFPSPVAEQRPTKRPTECLPMDKIKELLNLHTDHGQRELRDKAILHQLLFTGCRRQEVIGLNLNHVRQRSDGLIEVLSVTTKGGEPLVRIVPTEPGEVLIKLREMRLSEGATMDGPMYVTYHGKNGTTGRISPKWLWRHFKTWCEQVGIDPEWASPHSTRVTVVTKLLQEGHDYGAVASVTGHKSIEIVRKYDARFRAATDSPALKIKY